MPQFESVDHDPFADATGFFPAFDAAGARIPMDIDPSTGAPIYSSVSQVPRPLQALFGTKDVPRHQLWPEKMVRSGLALPHDVVAGTAPLETRAGFPGADPEGSRDVLMEPNLLGRALGMNAQWRMPSPEGEIGRTQDLSGLAVTGPLAAARGSATLGSGMTRPNDRYLVPALKIDGKVYKGERGGLHPEIMPDPPPGVPLETWVEHLETSPNVERGFVNHKGHFLDEHKAGEYAIDNSLIDPSHYAFVRNGGLVSDILLSDTGKPGSAVAALGKTASPFYSAVEHAINNVRNDKMSPDQWVGYLKNQPGVKAEELAWMGLDDPKAFGAGKKQLTKQELLDHAKEHGVEIKEVEKKGLRELSEEEIADIERDYERGRLTDEEYVEALGDEGHQDGTKFSQYQLPGGENYREMLFTLPQKLDTRTPLQTAQDLFKNPELKSIYDLHPDKFPVLQEELNKQVRQADSAYKSSHWDEPNVLAHVRMNDRFIPHPEGPSINVVPGKMERSGPNEMSLHPDTQQSGLKTLHLEELQSDWHQAGRKGGYQPDFSSEDVQTRQGLAGDTQYYVNLPENNGGRTQHYNTPEEALNAARHAVKMGQSVPNAPFKTTWPDLVLKRMIREASEKGYDAISWTPGEAQAARYDLSAHVDAIKAINNADGTYQIVAQGRGGRGAGPENLNRKVTKEKLVDTVGKDLAEKIIAQNEPEKIYTGQDLKLGGEGMKAFYDKMLVDKANAIAKKLGGKVEKQKLSGYEIDEHGPTGQKFRVWEEGPDEYMKMPLHQFATREDAEAWVRTAPKHEVHVLRLPQALRDTATRKGFPLFAAGLPFSFEPVDHDPFAKEK